MTGIPDMNASNFTVDASAALIPVLSAHGFKCTATRDFYVRLESSSAAIDVRYDVHRSYEVSVEFARIVSGGWAPEPPFNLGEIYRVLSVPDTAKSFWQTTDYESALAFLRATAIVLRDYCSDVFCESSAVFEALGVQRAKESHAYTGDIRLGGLQPRADVAWKQGDYAEFVRLLKPVEEFLSPADARKLKYAEKRAARN
jgi:hypothetical protein